MPLGDSGGDLTSYSQMYTRDRKSDIAVGRLIYALEGLELFRGEQ